MIYRSWDQIPYDNVSPSKEIQSERINLPKYDTSPSKEGFESVLRYKDKTYIAKGYSKRQAESSVAKKVLEYIKQKNV